MKHFILLFAVISLVGCHSHSKRTVDEFAFLELEMPIDVVTNRVGQPDRGYRGQYRLRYDLADGSEMVVTLHHKDEYSPDFWRVYWFGQWRGTNWEWLKEPSNRK